MKQLIFIGLLLGSMMSSLRAEGPPAPPRPPEAKEEPKEEPKLSTGERIEVPDVGFSIIPPNGWMVHKNAHGSSLLFEAPKQPNQTYQPTIQVMVFSKLRYIDEVTMKEYGDLIVEKFSKMSNRVTGYRLRDAAIQRLETGDPSILYYTEFQYDDVPIMQMHILISSATNHFVMTYTDMAKIFEDESSPGLAIAYTSMHSAQLATRPPWRWRGFAIGGGAALFVIIGWFSLRFLRARRLALLGQRIEDEDHKEITRDEESQYYSRHSPATHAESHAGDDEWASSKAQSKSSTGKVSQVQSSHFDEDDEPEVSDVVPISTLEKSLHPGRKRRQDSGVSAARHQAPPMPQPTSQHPPVSNHQPGSHQQPMQQPIMPQQGYAQQTMAPQATPQQAMHPQAQQAMMPPQGVSQQGMQPPYQQPMPPQAQQAMHPQGMQQPMSHSQQPLHPQGIQPGYQPAMNQAPAHQAMPPHAGQPAPIPHAQGAYPPPVPNQQPVAQHPVYPQGQQAVSQQPFQPPIPAAQNPMQPPVVPQQPFAAQQGQVAPMQQAPGIPPHMAASFAQAASMPDPASQPMSVAPQFAQNQATQASYIPHVPPQSQAPASEQPAYVHQAHAAAPMQAFAAPAATPAAVAQTFAAPAQAAPAMPQFAPTAADPISEPPITASRQTQSQMNRKQPRSQDIDDEPEMTEEARLSEILPKAGTIEKSKPKRKGLFWRKKTDDDDEQDDGGDEKASWNMPTSKKSKGKDDEDDADADAGDEWAVTPKKASTAKLADNDDEPVESEVWAPEATKKSDPKRDSLLNETQGPQHLVRRAPQGPVTKGNNAAVTEDDWNLNQKVTSDHDEEDEEEGR